uniref:Uncharacterized protein n=1 Tax=Macrostomum lignano TaxID=282301 RepID=A0A1I8F7P5_9PLAT
MQAEGRSCRRPTARLPASCSGGAETGGLPAANAGGDGGGGAGGSATRRGSGDAAVTSKKGPGSRGGCPIPFPIPLLWATRPRGIRIRNSAPASVRL